MGTMWGDEPDVAIAWQPDTSRAAVGIGDRWALLGWPAIERLRDALTDLLDLRARRALEPTREDDR